LSHSPIEPNADPSRRAWLACPNCDQGVGCAECRGSRNCGAHWQYLLKNDGTHVFLQCPTCFCVWTVDTAAVVPANRSRAAGADIKDQRTGDAAALHHRGSDDGEWDGGVVAKIWLGDCPRDIVTSPTGDLVWVMTADSVKAIKRFHDVVASFPIGAEPKQMMMSSDGSRIYVTGYDGSLSIIDPIKMTAKTVVKQISTAAVVSPDGAYIYLAHGEAVGRGSTASITAIRADGIAVARIAVDRYTTGMAMSPNGRRLYVASALRGTDDHGGTVAVIDTVSYETVDIIAVDKAPESLTVDADGLLYVTHYHTDSVSMIDPGTQCIIAIALDDAPMEVVAKPESEFIYTANLHSVTAIDPSTAATKSFALGELPRRLTISPDGRRLYATDFACGTIWCLDTSDNSVVGTVAACAHPAAVALSPTGEFLYVTDSRDGTLTVISTTAVNPHPQDTP
jgi:DNA-binding beta-propeller fold protein YncE